MDEDQSSQIEWIHCNKCLRRTKHSTVLNYSSRPITSRDNEGSKYWWSTTNTLLECCGCEFVTLRRTSMCSEWDEPGIEFYPPSVSRLLPSWHKYLPLEMNRLLQEIYTALHADSRRLALMGARTLIDMFAFDRLGNDVGPFKEKLKKLTNEGYLADKYQDVLNTALDAGNAAAHRAYKPSSKTLNHVIDVVENLIHFYALEKGDEVAKKEIPSRKSHS